MLKTKISKTEILQVDNPILREISSAIPATEISTVKIKKTITLLKKALHSQIDAAAISAIQIGQPIRLFMISKKVFSTDSEWPKKINETNDLIFINPKITKTSKTKQLLEEGCLSVKYVYGKVLRPEKVTIEAYDEAGKKFSRGFSGLLAQVVQHENDHLDGILFIDKAQDLQKISPEEYEKMLKELNGGLRGNK